MSINYWNGECVVKNFLDGTGYYGVQSISKPKKNQQKVIFKGTRPFWFKDIIENGNNLKMGAEYTIKTKEKLSSWTKITLEETGELFYNLAWFEEKDKERLKRVFSIKNEIL